MKVKEHLIRCRVHEETGGVLHRISFSGKSAIVVVVWFAAIAWNACATAQTSLAGTGGKANTPSVSAARLDPEMMRTRLRTQTVEEDQFLIFVMNLTQWDARYLPVVESSFLWAQARPDYPSQYFRNALRKQAPEIQKEWETGQQLDESAIIQGLATRVLPGIGTPLSNSQQEYISYVVNRARDGTIPPTLVVRVYNDVTGRDSFWKKYFSLQPRFVQFQHQLEEYIHTRRIRWNPPS